MNVGSWLLWGFVSTVVLTAVLNGSQGLGMTRMNAPYLLGTMFTPDRDRAKLIGVLVHFVNGWIFSLIYVAAFHSWGAATWWLGAFTGLVHSSFVLTAGLPLLPALHPRMANEQYGPTVARQLQPPGFLALHYGTRTPVSIVVAHLVYGAILGGFYALP
ncbi:MAG: hypothetical protein JO122_18655 [Acetobacteraceae bacterium]|nr:hypothetical protein [Acetobacteraceae bacterium]